MHHKKSPLHELNNYIPNTLAMYHVPSASAPQSPIVDPHIPSPPRTVIGDAVLREHALMQTPRAQAYLAQPHTH